MAEREGFDNPELFHLSSYQGDRLYQMNIKWLLLIAPSNRRCC